MSEMSFPYGSSSHDRRYKSSDFRAYYAQMIGNGVFYSNADALKVREGKGMIVLLSIGGAFIEGVGYRNTSDLAFKLDTADGALSRIDRIVIRNDYKKRDTYAAVLKGTYSDNPQAAALTRNADAYEIAVADVLVAKGVISITQAAITDTRLNNDLCGIVTGLIQQADTTEIFNQFTTFLNEFKQEHVAEFGDWTEEQKQEFVTWENGIRDILNENMAGNLLNMIGELKKLETTEKGNLVGALNEVFQVGNEKKQTLAENLIAMGMEASARDTWEQLLDKVLDMTDTSEDTVTAAALLAGYTAHNAMGEPISGEMPERAGTTVDASAVTQDATYTYFDVPPGHYDAASKVRSANSNLSGDIGQLVEHGVIAIEHGSSVIINKGDIGAISYGSPPYPYINGMIPWDNYGAVNALVKSVGSYGSDGAYLNVYEALVDNVRLSGAATIAIKKVN